MDDKPRRDAPLGTRVTVVEMRVAEQARRFDEHLIAMGLAREAQDRINSDQLALIRKLDERADRQDVMFARLLGGVAVIVSVSQLVGPFVLKTLGLGG